jgi:hypothetical protein
MLKQSLAECCILCRPCIARSHATVVHGCSRLRLSTDTTVVRADIKPVYNEIGKICDDSNQTCMSMSTRHCIDDKLFHKV